MNGQVNDGFENDIKKEPQKFVILSSNGKEGLVSFFLD